jgi:DNA-binding transcriptional regulator YdaS (Cro superfamily)
MNAKYWIDRLGGPSQIAKMLGIRAAAVSQWEQIPAKQAIRLSSLLGIPVSELRPDLWERPTASNGTERA